MRVGSVLVRNFRAVKEAELNCDALTALVGRNGAGKSTFLHALEYFYEVDHSVTDEDFFNRDRDTPIEIRVTFHSLSPSEVAEFAPYLSSGRLSVKKVISARDVGFNSAYFGVMDQHPVCAEIRTIPSKRERTSRWNGLVDAGGLVGQPRVRSADELEAVMKAFEAGRVSELRPFERETQFFGARNVGGGRLDKFTKFVLVPAIREVQDEVGAKRGAFYQILDAIVMRRLAARTDIREFQASMLERAQEVFSPDNLGELPQVEETLTRVLGRYAPGALVRLRWGDVVVPEVQPPTPRASLVEDAFEGEVGRKGHGLQRALIMTLLQYLAQMPLAQNAQDQGEDGSGAEASPTLILAIEEPELYLHPSRARHLARVLFELAMAEGASTQILYTTHSPHFVDLERFDQVRLVRKYLEAGGSAPSSRIHQYSLEEAADRMASVTQADPERFTRDTFRIRAIPIMSALVNEGFFSEVAVVVEGPSELGLLWAIQDVLGLGWSEKGVVIVMANGKNSIDRPVVIFRGLSIPTYFVFDGDSQLRGRDRQAAAETNRRLLRLAGAAEQDFPGTEVNVSWAVFEHNVEAVVAEAIGTDAFENLQRDLALRLGFDRAARVLKNSEGAAQFVHEVYKNGGTIQVLESVALAATNLLDSLTTIGRD